LLLRFICRLFIKVYALLVQEVTLIPVLILKRALLIPQNEAVFASDLQLFGWTGEGFLLAVLLRILRIISIVLRS
jgi:hypothetical protein